MAPTNDDWARALAGRDRNAVAYALVTAIYAELLLEHRRRGREINPPLKDVAEWLGMSPALVLDAIAITPRGAAGALRVCNGFVELRP